MGMERKTREYGRGRKKRKCAGQVRNGKENELEQQKNLMLMLMYRIAEE